MTLLLMYKPKISAFRARLGSFSALGSAWREASGAHEGEAEQDKLKASGSPKSKSTKSNFFKAKS